MEHNHIFIITASECCSNNFYLTGNFLKYGDLGENRIRSNKNGIREKSIHEVENSLKYYC